MANEEIGIGLSVVSDTAGTAKARQDLANVRKEIDELKAAFNRGDKGAEAFNKELANLEKREKSIKGAIDNTTKEFTQEAAAMKAAATEARKLAAEEERLARAQAKKPKAGSAGALQQLGRDIRGLPSVQVPGLGIGTDTFGRAAEVAGRLGVSMGQLALGAGVAVGALGAVAVAFSILSSEAEKQAKVLGGVIEANRKVGEDVAGGLTTEQAEKRLEELQRLATEEQKILDENTKFREQALNQLSEATGIARDRTNFGSFGGAKLEGSLFESLAGLNSQFSTLNNEITTSTATLEANKTEQNSLAAALEDGSIAANDAAKAEAELAAARTASVLTEASQAGDLATLKERVTELTKEQIDAELEALDRRRIGAEAELQSLEASGDTSEEVAKKIAQLKEQIGFLGEQAQVLNTAKPGAKSSEAIKAAEKAQKDSERAAEKSAKDAEKRMKDTAKAQQDYSDKIADAGTAFRDAIADINTSLKDNLTDNATKLQDDLNEGAIEFNQDQLKEERAYQRDLAQIKRESARAELDAVRARDFAALADAREQAADAISDRRSEERDENAEQLTEFQQQREALGRERDIANRDAMIDASRARRDASIDRQRAQRDAATDRQRALRDLNSMEQTFQRNSLTGWNNYFGQLSQMQNRATGSGGGRATGEGRATGTGSGRTGSSSISDELQHMVGSR